MAAVSLVLNLDQSFAARVFTEKSSRKIRSSKSCSCDVSKSFGRLSGSCPVDPVEGVVTSALGAGEREKSMGTLSWRGLRAVKKCRGLCLSGKLRYRISQDGTILDGGSNGL